MANNQRRQVNDNSGNQQTDGVNGTPVGTVERQPSQDALAERPSTAIASVEIEARRAMEEVRAAITIAKQFPRDIVKAKEKITQAFMDPDIAASATYQYAKGGSDVSGLSIRAAEIIAQNWCNFQWGTRELEQRSGETTVQAYAWDVENNTRSVQDFKVQHYIDTRRGRRYIDDPREIYELGANQGSRRVRARILALIPRDVQMAVERQADATLRTKVDLSPEKLPGVIKNILHQFAPFKVTREMLEVRIQRKLERITPALCVNLRKILNSITDGYSDPGDWFDLPSPQSAENGAGNGNGGSRADQLRGKLGIDDAKAPAAADPQSPGTPTAAVDAPKAEADRGGSLF